MRTFKQYLIEGPEIASRKTIKLQTEYDKLNKLLFNNELPKIPLKWNKSKTVGGRVISYGLKHVNSWELDSLEISDFMELAYDDFRSTLAHEMIHVKLIHTHQHDIDNDHGSNFRAELARINGMNLGFEVTTKDDVTNKRVSKDAKDKLYGVVLCYKDGKENGIAVYNAKTFADVVIEHFKLPKGFLKHFKFNFVMTNHKDLQKYPTKRKLGKGRFITYPVDPEFFSELLAGEHIASL